MTARNPKNQNSLNLFLNNYFNIVIILIAISVLITAYIMFIKPKYDETMAAIKSNIEQQQKIYGEQQKKLDSLKTLSELYNKISLGDLQKFNSVLPNDYVKESLFGELDEIITQNGFVVNSIAVNKVDDETKKDSENKNDKPAAMVSDKVSEINIELSLSAINYFGFKKLLKVLENNLRLFNIEKLSFSPEGNSLSLSLSTYYYKP